MLWDFKKESNLVTLEIVFSMMNEQENLLNRFWHFCGMKIVFIQKIVMRMKEKEELVDRWCHSWTQLKDEMKLLMKDSKEGELNERKQKRKQRNKIGRESWSSGYGWWLMFKRSWVWIPALFIGWTWHFSHWFVEKIVLFVWKEAGGGRFF